MNECLFCEEIEDESGNIFYRDESGLFVARWDQFPSTPGHAELIPTAHVTNFNELNETEHSRLGQAIMVAARVIKESNLVEVYEVMLQNPVDDIARGLIETALKNAIRFDRPPDAFNHGVNDGEAAGRTIPHLHYHLMPRWTGDVEDPRGGIRHMFPKGGNYKVSG